MTRRYKEVSQFCAKHELLTEIDQLRKKYDKLRDGVEVINKNLDFIRDNPFDLYTSLQQLLKEE
jgi:hypothetical protein